jgi:hypothetical protein
MAADAGGARPPSGPEETLAWLAGRVERWRGRVDDLLRVDWDRVRTPGDALDAMRLLLDVLHGMAYYPAILLGATAGRLSRPPDRSGLEWRVTSLLAEVRGPALMKATGEYRRALEARLGALLEPAPGGPPGGAGR